MDRIWISTYTPQVDEHSPEMLTPTEKRDLIERMADWRQRFPKTLMNPYIAQAFQKPPQQPSGCVFAKMSVNYSADLKTRVEPCIFGGNPDCQQCGCASSLGLHSLGHMPLLGPLKIGHLLGGSMKVGELASLIRRSVTPTRWGIGRTKQREYVQIGAPQ